MGSEIICVYFFKEYLQTMLSPCLFIISTILPLFKMPDPVEPCVLRDLILIISSPLVNAHKCPRIKSRIKFNMIRNPLHFPVIYPPLTLYLSFYGLFSMIYIAVATTEADKAIASSDFLRIMGISPRKGANWGDSGQF